jgi:general secretion pathway protein H
MPRSATSRYTGFTLLELLVVLVIIGIVSSFAVLSTGLTGRDKPLGKESQRLLALMQMASEESVLKTEELGLTVSNDGYHFLRYEQNAWQPLEDDLFRERSLPDNLTLDLVLEGRPIVLDDPSLTDSKSKSDMKDAKNKPKPPQILFLSSGEVSPFSLTLSEHPGTAQSVIKSVGDGSFTVGDGKEPAK